MEDEEEKKKQVPALLEQMDEDGDGKISKDEFIKAARTLGLAELLQQRAEQSPEEETFETSDFFSPFVVQLHTG